VLVRGTDPRARILESAKTYNTEFSSEMLTRIIFVGGNLDTKFFGLDEKYFDTLSEEIDIVIHNGAHVNHRYPYSMLRDSNVGGTVEAVRLCSLGKKKRLAFISSIGAFFPGEKSEGALISFDEDSMGKIFGYGATKRVSEKLIEQAVSNGLDAVTFRPATISGSLNGACNSADTINRLMTTFCELKVAPRIPEYRISLAPVDWVAKTIVNITMFRETAKPMEYFTVLALQQISLQEIVASCSEFTGENISEVPLKEFIEVVKKNEMSALHPLIKTIENANKEGSPVQLPVSDESAQFPHENLLRVVQNNPVLNFPKINKELVKKYVEFLIKNK